MRVQLPVFTQNRTCNFGNAARYFVQNVQTLLLKIVAQTNPYFNHLAHHSSPYPSRNKGKLGFHPALFLVIYQRLTRPLRS